MDYGFVLKVGKYCTVDDNCCVNHFAPGFPVVEIHTFHRQLHFVRTEHVDMWLWFVMNGSSHSRNVAQWSNSSRWELQGEKLLCVYTSTCSKWLTMLILTPNTLALESILWCTQQTSRGTVLNRSHHKF